MFDASLFGIYVDAGPEVLRVGGGVGGRGEWGKGTQVHRRRRQRILSLPFPVYSFWPLMRPNRVPVKSRTGGRVTIRFQNVELKHNV